MDEMDGMDSFQVPDSGSIANKNPQSQTAPDKGPPHKWRVNILGQRDWNGNDNKNPQSQTEGLGAKHEVVRGKGKNRFLGEKTKKIFKFLPVCGIIFACRRRVSKAREQKGLSGP